MSIEFKESKNTGANTRTFFVISKHKTAKEIYLGLILNYRLINKYAFMSYDKAFVYVCEDLNDVLSRPRDSQG